MLYALAHDENGIPLQVPTTATGWLVRRHSGGRGRPAAVYDAEGRPLVVPLDSTTVDLKANGCKPGMYRLDAVDGGRKPLNVTAYTEVQAGGDEVDAAPVAPADAGVAALARAVEAMQKVQAERERMQAEMFMRLIDRFSPAPIQPAQDLKTQLGSMVEVQKTLKKMGDAAQPRNAAPVEDDDGGGNQLAPLLGLAGQAMPMLQYLVFKKVIGLSDEQIMQMMAAMGGKMPPATATQAAPSDQEVAVDEAAEVVEDEAPAEVATIDKNEATEKFKAILSCLTPEERTELTQTLQLIPDHVAQPIQQQILTMPAEDAAAYLRSLRQQFAAFMPMLKKTS